MRFLYAYILCCLVFGLIVTAYEARKKTYQWHYIVRAFLFPSVVYGNWLHSLQEHPTNTQKYMRLQWMWRIHALLLLASIFVPYEFIGAQIASLAQPGIQTNHHVMVGAELVVDFGMAAIGGIVALVEFLVWTVVYLLLFFVLVIVPRIARPPY